jgi:hypothetical protein
MSDWVVPRLLLVDGWVAMSAAAMAGLASRDRGEGGLWLQNTN